MKYELYARLLRFLGEGQKRQVMTASEIQPSCSFVNLVAVFKMEQKFSLFTKNNKKIVYLYKKITFVLFSNPKV